MTLIREINLTTLANQAYQAGLRGDYPAEIHSDFYMRNYYKGDLERRRSKVKHEIF